MLYKLREDQDSSISSLQKSSSARCNEESSVQGYEIWSHDINGARVHVSNAVYR